MFINGVLCCFITVLVSTWALRDLPRKLTAHTMGRSVSSKALSGVHQLGQIRKVLTVRGSSLLAGVLVMLTGATCHAASDLGANDTSNTKIQKGGASTLQAGIAKTITRGVNLDNSNFSGLNLKGVAFQQSIVRDTSFKGCNLYSASFFDATLDGSDFTDADMTLANIELAQFNRAILKNTIAKEMYVVGTTQFEGIADIENSDWTDTDLSKYQRKLLCGLKSAKGTNSKTGVDTRESLMCPD